MVKAKIKKNGVKLTLTSEEALVLRSILYVTQLSTTGPGAMVADIADALDEQGYDPEQCEVRHVATGKVMDWDEAIVNGLLIKQESLDTGIYFVD